MNERFLARRLICLSEEVTCLFVIIALPEQFLTNDEINYHQNKFHENIILSILLSKEFEGLTPQQVGRILKKTTTFERQNINLEGEQARLEASNRQAANHFQRLTDLKLRDHKTLEENDYAISQQKRDGACFRTVVPPYVHTLDKIFPTQDMHDNRIEYEVNVTGAFKNLISEERMFVKSYIQLWSSKNDPSVRSHVFSYDRPCYPKFDLKKELTLFHRDSKVLERIEPILTSTTKLVVESGLEFE